MNSAGQNEPTVSSPKKPWVIRALKGVAFRVKHTSETLVNAAITIVVRTHKRRWKEVAFDPNPHWDWRNKIISGLIPANSSVVDLGCGAQTIRRHLPGGCKYQPCDLIKSTPDVVLCDFNAGIYPELASRYDYVICSGVLEYIRKPKEFLKRIASLGDTLILSYCPLQSGQGKLNRLSVNWINHMTTEQLDELFRGCDLLPSVINVQEHGETIYSLRPKGRVGVSGEAEQLHSAS
jgi:hypothetical protein